MTDIILLRAKPSQECMNDILKLSHISECLSNLFDIGKMITSPMINPIKYGIQQVLTLRVIRYKFKYVPLMWVKHKYNM